VSLEEVDLFPFLLLYHFEEMYKMHFYLKPNGLSFFIHLFIYFEERKEKKRKEKKRKEKKRKKRPQQDNYNRNNLQDHMEDFVFFLLFFYYSQINLDEIIPVIIYI